MSLHKKITTFVTRKLFLGIQLFFFLVVVVSSQDNESKQKVSIFFNEIKGASFYEIKFLESKKKDSLLNIQKIKTNPFVGFIPVQFKFVQIRAIFSDNFTTKWGEILTIQKKTLEADYKINNQYFYKIYLSIEKPYLYKNNVIWLGGSTMINFTKNINSLENQKIYYKLTKKNQSLYHKNFDVFAKKIYVRNFFYDIEDYFYLEYYSVYPQKKIRTPLNKQLIFIDTKPPIIQFEESDNQYTWKFIDKNQILSVEYSYDKIKKIKKNIYSLSIPKTQINDIKNVTITVFDLLYNQSTWNYK